LNSRNVEALAALLDETAQRYVDHQEDDLGKPVLKGEYFWGIARHFTTTLVALAADEADPTEVVDDVLRQVRARSLLLIERLQDEPSDDDEEDEDDEP
jgi:hypothetical protein